MGSRPVELLFLCTMLLLLVPHISAADAQMKSKASTLLATLLQAYEEQWKWTPPDYNTDNATKVEVSLFIHSVDSVNEATMDFTVSMLLHLKWLESRLVRYGNARSFEDFEFLEFDSTNINKIWIPDIFFPNEKSAAYHDIMVPNKVIRLYRTGEIVYISRLSMTMSCPMHLHAYPFDKQVCSILIMSFGFTIDKLVLEWMNETEAPITIPEDQNQLPQFRMTRSSPEVCHKRYHKDVGRHGCLQADFFLERNIGYYVVQMYIPSMLIVMLSWISFWLTVSSVPGRISLGVLTVLTITTQSSTVNASLPRVSYTKAIDVWMSTCLVFVFAALLEFAVVNVLSRKDTITGFSLRSVFSIPRNIDNSAALAEVDVPLDPTPTQDSGGENSVAITRKKSRRGIVYAMYLDVASRILFPTCFILFISIYWAYYLNSDFHPGHN